MYDTARRVALVKQRVRENTRRRQRCGICNAHHAGRRSAGEQDGDRSRRRL